MGLQGRVIVLFWVWACFWVESPVRADSASERNTLLALRAAVGGRSRLWNVSAADSCTWVGITCVGGRVVELHLPGMGLSGQLPLGLGNLTALQTLSVRFNALWGPVPPDLAKLPALRNLYLQGNAFSGPIPPFFFSMGNLVRLNLANNNFSGQIPREINNLSRLGTLYLEQNHFTGRIPPLTLPGLVQFNVSFNQLTGSIPSRVSGMPASAFEGNSLCGKPLIPCSKKKLSGGAVAGIVIGSVLGASIILAILIFCCWRKRKPSEKSNAAHAAIDIPSEKVVEQSGTTNPPPRPVASTKSFRNSGSGNKSLVFFGKAPKGYDLEDLLRASAEVLGKGTFGTTYKATLGAGIVVAVKRLKDVTVSEREYRERIEAVGAMDHENLVPLRSYYYSADERLLVYDYMPMGSLSALLHGNKGAGRTPLNWETRAGIALGAARGMAYLHSQGSTISHGNIKSSNILLTSSYRARVSDFGLAHVAKPTTTPSRVAGYQAPEVIDTQKVSQKADVYSFGVLLLELLTGKAPTHALMSEEGVDLPRWVQSVVREEWTSEVFDLELLRYQNVEEDMVQLLQLAIDCTAQYPDKRPSMTEVVGRAEEICGSSLQGGQEHQDIFNDVEETS